MAHMQSYTLHANKDACIFAKLFLLFTTTTHFNMCIISSPDCLSYNNAILCEHHPSPSQLSCVIPPSSPRWWVGSSLAWPSQGRGSHCSPQQHILITLCFMPILLETKHGNTVNPRAVMLWWFPLQVPKGHAERSIVCTGQPLPPQSPLQLRNESARIIVCRWCYSLYRGDHTFGGSWCPRACVVCSA